MKRTVLILDDDAHHLKLLAITLNKAFYNVHAFRRDSTALRFLEIGPDIDAIIFDFQIQGKDISDFILRLMSDTSYLKYRGTYKILCSNITLSNLQYDKNFKLLKYDEYVFKELGYKKKLIEKLNKRFGDQTINSEILAQIEKEELLELKENDYMFYPAFEKDSNIEDLKILISDQGIYEFSIKLSEAVSLSDIQMFAELLPVAILEKKKKELSQLKKASILGINRMKYIRSVKQLNSLADSKIKEFLSNLDKKESIFYDLEFFDDNMVVR